jgi:hypothetical protein
MFFFLLIHHSVFLLLRFFSYVAYEYEESCEDERWGKEEEVCKLFIYVYLYERYVEMTFMMKDVCRTSLFKGASRSRSP